MSGFICKCGNVIKFREIPHPNEWLFISEKEFDKHIEEQNEESLYNKMKSMFECPSCKRIWFFWDGFDEHPIPYIRDNSKWT